MENQIEVPTKKVMYFFHSLTLSEGNQGERPQHDSLEVNEFKHNHRAILNYHSKYNFTQIHFFARLSFSVRDNNRNSKTLFIMKNLSENIIQVQGHIF